MSDDIKQWKVFSAARYIDGKLQESFDQSHMSGGHPVMVAVGDYVILQNRIADLEQDRDSWRRVSERLEGEKQDLERQLARIPVEAKEWRRLYETEKSMRKLAERQLAEYKADSKEAWELQAEGNEENKRLLLQLADARRDAERMRVAIVEFYNDWQKGDFDLPELAQLDLRSVMNKAGYKGLLDKMDAAIGDHPDKSS